MSLTSRTRFVNPRLGTYFGIFASSLAGLVLLLLIFEQLGTSDSLLRWAMLPGRWCSTPPSACAPTQEPLEFFAGGRRVPAGYTGLGIGVAAMGATGIVAMTGLVLPHRLRRAVPDDRRPRRLRLHGGAAGAVLPQVRRLHGAELSRPPLRKQDACASSRPRCWPCPPC